MHPTLSRHLKEIILVASLLSGSAQAESITAIKIWTRAPGKHQKSAVEPRNLQHVQINKLKTIHKKLIDIQYDLTENYEGIYLRDLVAGYNAKNNDLIILHFSNNTLIPMSKNDFDEKFSRTVFLAIKIKIGKKWTSEFPKSRYGYSMHQNPLPVEFSGNKLVVSSGIHPYVDWKGEKDFSPWKFAASLVGIEYAERNAYERQFSVTQNVKAIEGQMIFLSRCQYCHGVNQLGAQFGWNVNGPIPLYQKRDAGSLFLKVKYPKVKGNYLDTGMPNQRDFTEDEAKSLWEWLKAATKFNTLDYRP